jgi:hypothetical protein
MTNLKLGQFEELVSLMGFTNVGIVHWYFVLYINIKKIQTFFIKYISIMILFINIIHLWGLSTKPHK